MELTVLEVDAVQRFLLNEHMVSGVEKVVLHGSTKDLKIDYEKLNNEAIGERMRARKDAEQLIKKGFNELESYRAVEEPTKEPNPAR